MGRVRKKNGTREEKRRDGRKERCGAGGGGGGGERQKADGMHRWVDVWDAAVRRCGGFYSRGVTANVDANEGRHGCAG